MYDGVKGGVWGVLIRLIQAVSGDRIYCAYDMHFFDGVELRASEQRRCLEIVWKSTV